MIKLIRYCLKRSGLLRIAIIFFLGYLLVIVGKVDAFIVADSSESRYGFTELRPIIGIDLGTTYSRVGAYIGGTSSGHIEIIPNEQGNRATPSWVAFTDGETLIGEAAKNQSAINSQRTIFDVKRLIGKKFDDKDVQKYVNLFPYKIVNKDGRPYIQVNMKDGETKAFSPEEISAMIIVKMKETAEAFLGEKVKNVVITAPSYFNDHQRQAIKNASVFAGVEIFSTYSESVITAFAYGLDKESVKNILIVDLGGGHSEVSIVNIEDGMVDVLATIGDTHLGGEDFDERMMKYFIKLINKKHGKDMSKDTIALDKLRRECERAKRVLSTESQVHVEIESMFNGTSIYEPLSRGRFERLNMDLFMKIMGLVKKAIDEAKLRKKQIDEIVVVGGGSRIPKVQQLLKDYFDGKEPKKGVKPEEAVAYAAALIRERQTFPRQRDYYEAGWTTRGDI